MQFYAHSLPGDPPTLWEPMSAHEQAVAARCRGFLQRIDPALGAWGDTLGKWHDLGKYQPDFQRKLAGESIQIEHAGAGALLAYQAHPKQSIPIQFAIAGHHTGLANRAFNDPKISAVSRLTLTERLRQNADIVESVKKVAPQALINLPIPEFPKWILEGMDKQQVMRRIDFFTRILFSCLIDSDRLATNRFYALSKGETPNEEKLCYNPLESLRDRLDQSIDQLAKSSTPSPIQELREHVLNACRIAAPMKHGLFSLTVPTGGGKTLSAMSFALNHAIASENGLDRVIVVIPYTSIIRQNAQVYRNAVGDSIDSQHDNVIEHHSGIDSEQSKQANKYAEIRRRLAVENWDAPIVVTTSVQFFETLFSDHPSQCRKLHRIANSVVILDEIQTLPPEYLLPIVDVLRELVTNYKTSVVLSTATPPSLGKYFDDVREIVEQPAQLANHPAARRVTVEWRIDKPVPLSTIGNELVDERTEQALIIVHRRKEARVMAEFLPPAHRIHLSAQMCPAHRIARLDEIHCRLKAKEPCLIASTQLIEAGVNLDLPIVYRALAGIDSLAQAAGRCDREGLRTLHAGQPAGRLIVFLAETLPPGQSLKRAMEATQMIYRKMKQNGDELDIFNPLHCNEFFKEFYAASHLDEKQIQRERAGLNFANVAANFRMIEDGWSFPVVVPWPFAGPNVGEGKQRVERFREDPSRESARALQPYVVQVPRQAAYLLNDEGVIEIVDDTIGLPTQLFTADWYSEEFGLIIDEATYIDPSALMT